MAERDRRVDSQIDLVGIAGASSLAIHRHRWARVARSSSAASGISSSELAATKVGLLSFFFFFFRSVFSIFRCKLIRRIAVAVKDGKDEEDSVAISATEQRVFRYDKLAAATGNFSTKHKLGEGGFGPVYKVPLL